MAEDTNTQDGAGQETQQQLPPLFNATLAQLSADRENALAVLEMLFNRSVGIGDHTNIVEEITKTAAKLAECNWNHPSAFADIWSARSARCKAREAHK